MYREFSPYANFITANLITANFITAIFQNFPDILGLFVLGVDSFITLAFSGYFWPKNCTNKGKFTLPYSFFWPEYII